MDFNFIDVVDQDEENAFEDFLLQVEMQKILIEDPDSLIMIQTAMEQVQNGVDVFVVSSALNELIGF